MCVYACVWVFFFFFLITGILNVNPHFKKMISKNWQTTVTCVNLSRSEFRCCVDISQCYAWFVYTDKLPLLSSLNTTRLVTISEYYHCGVSSLSLHTFDHLSPFHSDSEPPFLAGSFWMLFVALFLSYLRTHKNAGIFFFLGGILTFIMYIFCLESMHCIKLHMVWTRNFFFSVMPTDSFQLL